MQNNLRNPKFFDGINEGVSDKLQAMSYFEEEDIVEIVNNVLYEGIKIYEERNGTKYLELWNCLENR